MKFVQLRIDGFGVWSGLEIRALDPGLNVFYGPNEAGKTTLLEFMRAVLYGFSLNRRRRYLPPVRGGESGGSLGVATADSTCQIRRTERANSLMGEVNVVAADGTVQGEGELIELLGDVDEAIFQNVFALGLEELQHLGALDATDAARLLYGLSAGMDRVSLSEVMQELDISRRRMLCDEGQSQIGELLSKRERLCEQIDQLSESTGQYWRLSGERDELATAITMAEAEVGRVDREARIHGLARSLAEKWDERTSLDERLAALGPVQDFPSNALARMRQITSGIRRHRRRLARIHSHRKQLRADIAALAIREPLWRLAPRIESLAEHESWIGSVEKELQSARQAVEQIEAQMAAGRGKLGLTAAGGEPLDLSPRRLSALRSPATELRRAVRAARESQAAVKQAEDDVVSQSESIEAALSARGLKELNPALEQAGQAVAQWRRRVQLDDRLERMGRHRTELEEDAHTSLERQIMPGWMLAALGAVFVVGVLLLFASWLLSGTFSGTPGWALALLGIAAFGGAVATKFILERSAARRLDGYQKQLVMLESQTKQLQDERTGLDKQLSAGGTPSARLQTAEADLAALEELLPLEAKRQSAEQQLPLAEREAEQAKNKLRAAHNAWQSALAAAGLPKKLSPKQIRQLRRSASGRADLRVQYAAAREQRDRIQRELAALTARIEPLFAESGLTPTSDSPSQQLRQLGRELADEKTRANRRESMLMAEKKLASSRRKRRAAVERLRRRGKSLLHRAGAANRAELSRKAAERSAADDLAKRRELLHRGLIAACTGICEPAEIAALLDGSNRAQLVGERRPGAISQTLAPIDAARGRLHELLEQRGRLGREMDSLANEPRLGVLQLQLAASEQALAEAIQRWQVVCTTLKILQQIKDDYERRGQPETLLTASEYLNRLTDSRYCRVWTPLGENTLLVDDADGSSLAVELMSRGAREQLFLALRLALVDYYRRREIEMPLVLDDVLVNFDDERSARAAEVLRDFAATGNQLLVFICHERLAAVFESLGVPVRRLPRNTEPGQIVEPAIRRAIAEQPSAEEAPPRRRRAKPTKPVEVQEAIETAVEAAVEPIIEPVIESVVEAVAEPIVEVPANESSNGHAAVAAIEPLPAQVQELPRAAVEILAEPIEVPRSPPRQHRADPPHPVARVEPQQTVRRRWSAEEFAGELEDRVRQPSAEEDQSATERS